MSWLPRYIGFLKNEVVEGALPCEVRLYYTVLLEKPFVYNGLRKGTKFCTVKMRKLKRWAQSCCPRNSFPSSPSLPLLCRLRAGAGLCSAGVARPRCGTKAGSFQHSGKGVFMVCSVSFAIGSDQGLSCLSQSSINLSVRLEIPSLTDTLF